MANAGINIPSPMDPNVYRRFANIQCFCHLNWLEQFLPWHPKPPTTKIFEDASNNFSVDKFKANMRCCVSVFMHACGCNHVQKLSNNLLVRLRRDTYSRTKMLKSLGFFPGPENAGIKHWRSPPSVPKAGQQPKNVGHFLKVNLEIPEPRGKKKIYFGKSTLIPYPHPPEKVELGVF